MDQDLNVHVVRNRKAAVDRCWRCAPVFVDFQPTSSSLDLFDETSGSARIALTEKAEVNGKGVGSLQHPAEMPGARRARRGGCTSSWSGTTSHHGGYAREQRFLNLLWAYEMDMCIDTTR